MNKIPKLRFPEFSGEWEEKRLENLNLKVIDGDRGVNYPSANDFSFEGYCLFLNAKNVTKTGFSFEEKNFITKEKDDLLRKGKLQKSDLVLTTRGTVGNIAYFNSKIEFENMRINSGMVIIRNENLNISPNYVYQYFLSPIMGKNISNISFGSAQPQLTVKEINNFEVPFPSLPEQEEIASFLSSVDSKIEKLERKKELWEQYKKGMMQKIFSQDLRFKNENGEDYPEWEEKSLGEISDIRTGKKDLINKVDDGEYPFFVRSKNIEKINSYSFDGEAILIPGDGQIGQVYHYINGKFDYHQRVYKISDFISGKGKYIYYYLQENFMKHALENTSKATVDSLRLPIIKEFLISLPSLPEQTQIADFLSSLDSKIEIVEKELTGMKEFKKGLLQKMFV